MTALHLIVGLPGQGKTTLALHLARDLPALRLSADDLQLAVFGDDVADPAHGTRHDAFEAALWPLAVQAMQAGAQVILDFGFWSRAERADFRARAAALGFPTHIHAPPDPGRATRLARIAARAHGFSVTEAEMADWERLYEPPGPDETAAADPWAPVAPHGESP
jgi:predicted kinase